MDDAQHGNDPDQQKGRFALFLILTSMFVFAFVSSPYFFSFG